MAPLPSAVMPSFDVVSEVDHQEVRNAVDQAQRELSTRFDFKNTNSSIEQNDLVLTLRSSSEDRLRALRQVLEERLVKRGVSLKGLDYAKVEEAAGSSVRQVATITVGISSDKAREINRMIKEKGPKGVSSQTQGDQVRVTGKKRDDLQAVIAAAQGRRPRHPPAVHELPRLNLRRRPPLRFGRLLLASLGNASGRVAVRRQRSRTHRGSDAPVGRELPARAGSAGDVLRREAGPGRAEEHDRGRRLGARRRVGCPARGSGRGRGRRTTASSGSAGRA